MQIQARLRQLPEEPRSPLLGDWTLTASVQQAGSVTDEHVGHPLGGPWVSERSMSDTAQNANYANDPWEGTGAAPLRWRRPFYQGGIDYSPPLVTAPSCWLASVDDGLPHFGGAEVDPEPSKSASPEQTCTSAETNQANAEPSSPCANECAICFAPCAMAKTAHGLHLCQRHRLV